MVITTRQNLTAGNSFETPLKIYFLLRHYKLTEYTRCLALIHVVFFRHRAQFDLNVKLVEKLFVTEGKSLCRPIGSEEDY